MELVDKLVLCECMNMTFLKPCSKWVRMIAKANLWEFERREAVREMLGSLISQQNKSSLTDSEMREAAEKALEWTRWDEKNCANSRLRNSLEYITCMQAMYSGRDTKEAFKQFDALVSEA